MKPTIYTKSVLQLVAIAIGLYMIYTVRAIVIYFIIASVISLVAKPIVNQIAKIKIRRFGIPRALAAAVTIIVLFFGLILLNYLLLPSFASEIAVLSNIDFHKVSEGLESEYSSLKEFLGTLEIDMGTEESNIKQSILGFLNVDTITSAFGGVVGGLGNLAVATFAILFMLFFFLKEENLTLSIISGLIPDKYMDRFNSMIPQMKHTLTRYFRGLLIQMIGIFTLVFVGLKFFVGLESALVIALFAATANLIPYIGPIFGMAFGVIIGVGQAYALGMDVHYGLFTLQILSVFAVTQVTDNIFFQPIIFSNSINAHPLEIFVVIAIAGTLAGATGMIIAIPAYSALRIFAKEFLQNIKVVRSLTKNI